MLALTHGPEETSSLERAAPRTEAQAGLLGVWEAAQALECDLSPGMFGSTAEGPLPSSGSASRAGQLGAPVALSARGASKVRGGGTLRCTAQPASGSCGPLPSISWLLACCQGGLAAELLNIWPAGMGGLDIV